MLVCQRVYIRVQSGLDVLPHISNSYQYSDEPWVDQCWPWANITPITQWIGLREILQENPPKKWENIWYIWFPVKIFPTKPIHWITDLFSSLALRRRLIFLVLWQTATTTLDRPKTFWGRVQLSLLGGPTKMSLTSGNSSYWTWPFIVYISMKHGDFPQPCEFTGGYSMSEMHLEYLGTCHIKKLCQYQNHFITMSRGFPVHLYDVPPQMEPQASPVLLWNRTQRMATSGHH